MPVPPVPPSVTHDAVVLAVQRHVDDVVTVNVPDVAGNVTVIDAGNTVKEHPVAADWFTVTVCPPTVIVPERDAEGLLPCALKLMTAPPLPPAAEVSVIHGALLAAVHGQALPVARVTLPVPPPDATDWFVGVTV